MAVVALSDSVLIPVLSTLAVLSVLGFATVLLCICKKKHQRKRQSPRVLISCRHHPLPDASVLSFFETPRRLPASASPYGSTTLPLSTPRPRIPLRMPFATVAPSLATLQRPESPVAPVHGFGRVWSKGSLAVLPSPSTFAKTSTPGRLSPSGGSVNALSPHVGSKASCSPLKKRLKF